LCLLAVSGNGTGSTFSFREYFTGSIACSSPSYEESDWDFLRETLSLKTIQSAPHASHMVSKMVTLPNGDLEGTQISDHSEQYVAIKFSGKSGLSGDFLQGEDTDCLKTLFRFDFHSHPNCMAISEGPWYGERPGFYQFLVLTSTTFLLTIYPSDGSTIVRIFGSPSKSVAASAADAALFRGYGPLVLVFVMAAVAQWLSKPTKPKQTPPRPHS